MKLIICEVCKRPYLETKGECPSCPGPFNGDSVMAVGCLLAMTLPILLVILLWVVFFSMLVSR